MRNFAHRGHYLSNGIRFNGQTCIRRILTISGVLLVYYGVSDAEVGVVSPRLQHFVSAPVCLGCCVPQLHIISLVYIIVMSDVVFFSVPLFLIY